MRGIKLLIFVSLIFLIIPSVQANEYNTTDGRGSLLFPETAFSTPMDPKVACHPDGIHCMMLVYENNTFFGRGVKVFFSTDFFVSPFQLSQITSVSTTFSHFSTEYFPNFHFPYDVSYVNREGKYYFFVQNRTFSYDGTTLTDLGLFPATASGGKWGLQFASEERIMTFESNTGLLISTMKGTVLGFDIYSIRDTAIGVTTHVRTGNFYNGSNINISPSNICVGVNDCLVNISLATFPTDFDGLDHFTNQQVVFTRFHNSTWGTVTSDLVNYETPTLIYEWNVSGITDETINNTDAFNTTNNVLYAYRRTSSDANNGIWIYNLPLNRVIVSAEGFNPERRSTESLNLTVTLNCSDEGFTSTSSGKQPEIFTPCTDGNSILLTSFNFRPTTFVFDDFTIPPSCEGLTNYIATSTTRGYYKPYDFTITYFDSIFGDRLDDVTATLNGDSDNTNANGQVVFEVFPIINEDFTITEENETCSKILSFTGNPKPFVLLSSKDGYQSQTENFQIATSPFDVQTDFETTKTIFLNPTNTEINVRLFSQDGVEIFPAGSVTIILTGSNATFWSLNNELFETNVASSLPTRFFLFNNTGTFPINVSVNYFGEFNVSIDVTVNTAQTVDVFIDASSWELPCNTLSDCTPDLCIGQFFKNLQSCTNNQCTYQTLDCITSNKCDVSLGCVDLVSTTNCTVDGNCENTCADNTRMLNNKCGSNGICKSNFVTCQQDCNATLGYCQELVQCLNKNERQFTAGFINPTTSGFNGGKIDAFCDFSTVNKRTCGFPDGLLIRSADLNSFNPALTLDDVIVDPNGWPAKAVSTPEDGYELYAVSILCNEFCNMSWEFCENGCDINTGLCKGIARTVDDTLGIAGTSNDVITGFWNLYDAVFSDIHSQSFVWFVIGIFFLLIINAIGHSTIPKGSSLSVTKEFDVIFLLIWIFIGSLVTTSIPGVTRFYSFVWLAMTVLAVLYFVNWVRIRQAGGSGGGG